MPDASENDPKVLAEIIKQQADIQSTVQALQFRADIELAAQIGDYAKVMELHKKAGTVLSSWTREAIIADLVQVFGTPCK